MPQMEMEESRWLPPRGTECSRGGMIVVFFLGFLAALIQAGSVGHENNLHIREAWAGIERGTAWLWNNCANDSATMPPSFYPQKMKNLPRLNCPQLLCHFMCSTRLTCHKTGWSRKPEISFWPLRFRVEVERQVTNTRFTRETVTSASFPPVVPPPLEVFHRTFYKQTGSEVPQQAFLFLTLWLTWNINSFRQSPANI